MTQQRKRLFNFIAVIVLALFVGLISYPKAVKFAPPFYDLINRLKINLGLDLQGGIHLEYKADISQIDSTKANDAMQALQDSIEKRVNAFGVAEPVIYTTKSGTEKRLIVELAGIKDINEAKKLIQETPFLEFRELAEVGSEKYPNELAAQFDEANKEKKKTAEDILARALKGENFGDLAKKYSEDPGSKEKGGELDFIKKGKFVPEFDKVIFEGKLKNGEIYPQLVETQFGWHIIKKIEERGTGDDKEIKAAHILIGKMELPPIFIPTGLTGKNLKNAAVDFSDRNLGRPQIALQFDEEGIKLFAEITKRNIGKPIAIYLDGEELQAPVVQTEITNGQAVITWSFTVDEAKKHVRDLNQGALPVPISLVSQNSIEASLGEISLQKSFKAGIIGLVLVVIFMISYYRFLGFIASLALLIYTGVMVAIFKISSVTPWSITLTLPGLAGFILSIGMAVDANILIFERTKEEIRRGRNILSAIDEGFKRAWTSIRDGNVSSIITSLILIEFGTGFVKGFAVTLIIGVLVSMFTAITVSRTLLRFIISDWIENKLWLIGVKKPEESKKNV